MLVDFSINLDTELLGLDKIGLELDKIAYKVDKFLFPVNTRSKISEETNGFIKVLARKKIDQVLGIHIIGDAVGEFIAEEADIAMEFKSVSEDLARICNICITLNQEIKEIAFATYFKLIYLYFWNWRFF